MDSVRHGAHVVGSWGAAFGDVGVAHAAYRRSSGEAGSGVGGVDRRRVVQWIGDIVKLGVSLE